MADEISTQTVTTSKGGSGSDMFGVSVRGWIAFGVVAAVCGNQLMATITTCYIVIVTKDLTMLGSQTTIVEPLYSLCTMAVGFYFGKQTK